MARRGKRTRIATGIYRDGSGIAAQVTVRGHTEELRFPTGTPLLTIQQARSTRRRLLDEDLPAGAARGTVGRAVEDYLAGLPDGPYATERCNLLAPWVTAIGDVVFALVTTRQLEDARAAWLTEGLSISRINKRISALRQVWKPLAPDDGRRHPIERLTRAREPKARRDRARPWPLIALVLEQLGTKAIALSRQQRTEEARTRAQLTALALTGLPTSLLTQLRPEHLRTDTDPPELYVQPRRKGQGVDAGWIAITPHAASALQGLFRRPNYARAHRGVLRLAWRRAVARTQALLRDQGRAADAAALQGMRVYDLRHSFLTRLALTTGDAYAVSEYARHSDLRTTLTYIQGASSTRVKAAIQALTAIPDDVPDGGARFGATKPPKRATGRRQANTGDKSKTTGKSHA